MDSNADCLWVRVPAARARSPSTFRRLHLACHCLWKFIVILSCACLSLSLSRLLLPNGGQTSSEQSPTFARLCSSSLLLGRTSFALVLPCARLACRPCCSPTNQLQSVVRIEQSLLSGRAACHSARMCPVQNRRHFLHEGGSPKGSSFLSFSLSVSATTKAPKSRRHATRIDID